MRASQTWNPQTAAEPEIVPDLTPQRFCFEVAAWAAIAIIAWGVSARYSFFDKIVAFSREYDRWQVDEIFSLIIIAGITAFAASIVQSRDLRAARRQAERRAFFAARRDALTDLPNRRMFTELAGNALGEAWRKDGKCAILFIDLDGFKPINDTFGHGAGDAVLLAVAELLREHAPQPALPARLGGDEFAILLPNIAGEADAVALAEKVLDSIGQPIEAAGYRVTVGATIGIAAGPENGRRAEDLIHAADLAMYEAKRAGKGTIRVYAGRPDAHVAAALNRANPTSLTSVAA